MQQIKPRKLHDRWTVVTCSKAAGTYNKLLLLKATSFAQNTLINNSSVCNSQNDLQTFAKVITNLNTQINYSLQISSVADLTFYKQPIIQSITNLRAVT
jgi:hypothetical protein